MSDYQQLKPAAAPYRRVFLIVLDGLGVGGAPDAEAFGDAGSDTLRHALQTAPVELPTLAALGLGNLYPGGLPGLPRTDAPLARCARLTELSAGKDTTTGHWELMGIVRDAPSPTFPSGFPAEFIADLKRVSGRGVLANHVASGTQVIADYGAEHLASGKLIVYTSADSVLQIAAHVDVVPLSELYHICRLARALATGPLAVDRVIARPFSGTPESGFTRTPNRRDFSLAPPSATVLDELKAAGRDVIGVGKIGDIFAQRGLTESHPVHGNTELMSKVSELAARDWHGLLFVNLVDFDMLYGHRNDAAGMTAALAEFDAWLSEFIGTRAASPQIGERAAGPHSTGPRTSGPQLLPDDLLIITADHGNDPTTPSTDHSREQVPLLLYSPDCLEEASAVAPQPGFYHVGATVATVLGVKSMLPGRSLL